MPATIKMYGTARTTGEVLDTLRMSGKFKIIVRQSSAKGLFFYVVRVW